MEQQEPRDHGTGSPQFSSELLTTLHHLTAPQEEGTVVCRFRYAAAEPLCVHMHLLLPSGQGMSWVIGRDLLLAGTEGLSGEGDVKVWPSRSRQGSPSLYLHFQRLDASATFVADLTEIRQWLEHTYTAVPAGTESLLTDWDDLAAGLLRPPA
ncbi:MULTISPECIES: SsgA family sporulation/cell division regulator [unclassified Streptomyces]|uniref:SsgA family sporulation/cell division regulator n=1 Tax=unclassified Streptomyces TaxID=2593676 RepID=UPI0004CBB06B|nr:SsgA family sporulation/cell division regulator [Streptomyces sp. NRRL S-31]